VILASFKSPEGFDCYLHALRFYTTYERADYYDAQDCAENASKALPADANVLALVALLELAGASFWLRWSSFPRAANTGSTDS
jgi:hypothetical protein